jgi:hypothetical protein
LEALVFESAIPFLHCWLDSSSSVNQRPVLAGVSIEIVLHRPVELSPSAFAWLARLEKRRNG